MIKPPQIGNMIWFSLYNVSYRKSCNIRNGFDFYVQVNILQSNGYNVERDSVKPIQYTENMQSLMCMKINSSLIQFFCMNTLTIV